jgi:nitrite reductase/ring-hydroxylating ferredoxin subunit
LADLVLSETELWIGEMRGVVVRGERLLVVRGENGVCVFHDRCPHQGHPLSEGILQAGVLTCRVHRHTFDAASGAGINPPRPCLRAVPSRVEAGQVLIELSEPPRAVP